MLCPLHHHALLMSWPSATGEYVAVEKLEGSYKKNLNVDQIWVYGNSFKNSLVAVVVPSAKLKDWAAANGVEGDMAQICKSDKARKYLLEVCEGPHEGVACGVCV